MSGTMLDAAHDPVCGSWDVGGFFGRMISCVRAAGRFFACALIFFFAFLKKCLGPRVRGAGFHATRSGTARRGGALGCPREAGAFFSSRARRGGHGLRARARPSGARPSDGRPSAWCGGDRSGAAGPPRKRAAGRQAHNLTIIYTASLRGTGCSPRGDASWHVVGMHGFKRNVVCRDGRGLGVSDVTY